MRFKNHTLRIKRAISNFNLKGGTERGILSDICNPTLRKKGLRISKIISKFSKCHLRTEWPEA